MAKAEARLGFIRFCLTLGIIAVLGRAAQLQLVEGSQYAERSERVRTVTEVLPARRGTIYDRGMFPLAETQEAYHVSLAPEQVTDRAALARKVARALGENSREIAARLGSGARSVYFFGPYTALDVQSIRSLAGVHLEPFLRRIHPMGDLANRTVGILEPDTAVGASGLESALDSLLTGVPGETVQLRDHLGRRFDSPARLVREPVAGSSVVLTIDARLQEIAERALDEALDSSGARSGDAVFLDPSTGELLAVASRVEGERSSASAFTTPYEPGSTAKLFTAAALLLHHAVDSTDTVNGENGDWMVPTTYGRPYHIHDDHEVAGTLTLAEAIEVSSNIAMAKFARRLTPSQLYETLRSFGFGSFTGVGFPSESRGSLPRPVPREWTRDYTLESLSRGYGLSVTAVQLASAYAVIANGGVLYTPALVKEVLGPDGSVLYQHAPEPVRRVLPEDVAATLRGYLKRAVSTGGTGERAQIQNYELVGKTGTAKVASGGRYDAGQYVASFASIWPADNPQIVAVIKIDRPRGVYYASQTAAPLTSEMLQQALASRNQALKLDELVTPSTVTPSRVEPPTVEQREAEPKVVRVAWPAGVARDSTRPEVAVPDMAGRDTRSAATALFAAGFRVKLDGGPGSVREKTPAAGSSVPSGSTIILHTTSTATVAHHD
jgi:cell division protein FtsI/penicillin-binding protein 2